MNIQEWKQQMLRGGKKKATPVLSFPSVQLMGITVRELISSAESQSRGMKLIADRVDSAASVSLMDLSVEAEAFGAEVRFSDDEIPTVVGARVTRDGGSCLRRHIRTSATRPPCGGDPCRRSARRAPAFISTPSAARRSSSRTAPFSPASSDLTP